MRPPATSVPPPTRETLSPSIRSSAARPRTLFVSLIITGTHANPSPITSREDALTVLPSSQLPATFTAPFAFTFSWKRTVGSPSSVTLHLPL